MIRILTFLLFLASSAAFGESISNVPIEVYKSVKSTIAKITLSGKVLQTCMTPIPSNRLQVELYYVPQDAALKDKAAKEPVTRIDLDGGSFSRIVEIPEGDYRIKVINLRDNKPVSDQRLVVGSKDIRVDLLVDCEAKKETK